MRSSASWVVWSPDELSAERRKRPATNAAALGLTSWASSMRRPDQVKPEFTRTNVCWCPRCCQPPGSGPSLCSSHAARPWAERPGKRAPGPCTRRRLAPRWREVRYSTRLPSGLEVSFVSPSARKGCRDLAGARGPGRLRRGGTQGGRASLRLALDVPAQVSEGSV